jgi:hypothetical protein
VVRWSCSPVVLALQPRAAICTNLHYFFQQFSKQWLRLPHLTGPNRTRPDFTGPKSFFHSNKRRAHSYFSFLISTFCFLIFVLRDCNFWENVTLISLTNTY